VFLPFWMRVVLAATGVILFYSLFFTAGLVDGTSWALRGAAACALAELAEMNGGIVMRRAKEGAKIRGIAEMLRGRRWRDKERVAPKLDKLFPPPPGASGVEGASGSARKRQLEGEGEEASADM
jgi:hypothetical protein